VNNAEQHLKRIQDKLQQLLKQHTYLQKENQLLKEQLNSSRQQLADYEKNIDDLKQKVEILQLSNGEMHETDRKQFEKRINHYVKEIDRCIAMLSA
jgi:septal ring factor EnvC (AmiA/AmiB activator)